MPIETIKHENVIVEIHYDKECGSPLEWENDIIFATWERNSIFSSRKYRPFDEPEEANEWADANGYEILPLYKYEHGQVAYSCSKFSCPWDSGQAGWFLFRHGTFGEHSLAGAKRWLEMFSDWCNGNCYGFIIKSASDDEEIDACWGFIGWDDVTQAYKDQLDWAVKEEQRRQDAALRSEALIDGGWIETQV